MVGGRGIVEERPGQIILWVCTIGTVAGLWMTGASRQLQNREKRSLDDKLKELDSKSGLPDLKRANSVRRLRDPPEVEFQLRRMERSVVGDPLDNTPKTLCCATCVHAFGRSLTQLSSAHVRRLGWAAQWLRVEAS